MSGVFLDEFEFKGMVASDELYERLKIDHAELEADFKELSLYKRDGCNLLTAPKWAWFTLGILSGALVIASVRK